MTKFTVDLEKKYAIGVKVAGIGLGVIDYENNEIVFDARAAALFDIEADTPISRDDVHGRIHPDDRESLNAHVERLLDPSSEKFFEIIHRVVHRDGTVLWLSARKQVELSAPNEDGSQHPISGLVAIIDITALKANEERTQYLLEELNHRVKNMLSVVQGIARLTFRSGDMDAAKERFSKRLGGLSHNLDALVKGDWTFADLTDLVSAHLQGFGTNTAQIEIEGPRVLLNTAQAQAIGMAMHELATNAFKYGALSVVSGKVRVAWELKEDGQLSMTWTETGGPAVTPPSKPGFGTKVIKQMAASSLNGTVEIDYRPAGLFWHVQFPLEETV